MTERSVKLTKFEFEHVLKPFLVSEISVYVNVRRMKLRHDDARMTIKDKLYTDC